MSNRVCAYQLPLATSISLLLATACHQSASDPCAGTISHPYRPPAGCSYLFAGQNSEQLGGLPESGFSNGYLDHVTVKPSGITLYGVFPEPGDMTPFAEMKWVADADRYLNRPGNEDMIMHLSIAWVPEHLGDNEAGREEMEKALLEGAYDTWLDALADWVNSHKQPFLLRPGYEFNRPIQKLYSPQHYAACFRHIVDRLRARGIKGTAFVWASANMGFSATDPDPDTWDFDTWYPGDAYVDWFGFSVWFPNDVDTIMLEQARARNRPVLLAETTPSEWHVGERKHYPFMQSTGEVVSAERLWSGWWQPMIDFVTRQNDVVAGWHYIAADWRSDPMWAGVPFFTNSDARLWLEPTLKGRWEGAVSQAPFVQRGAVKFVR